MKRVVRVLKNLNVLEAKKLKRYMGDNSFDTFYIEGGYKGGYIDFAASLVNGHVFMHMVNTHGNVIDHTHINTKDPQGDIEYLLKKIVKRNK